MSKHTPEPWNGDGFFVGGRIISESGAHICEMLVWRKDFEPEQLANAHRIVACVNALKGFSDSDLKAGIVGEMMEGLKKLSTSETFHPDTLPTWIDHSDPMTKEMLARRDFASKLLSKIGKK